MGQPHTTPAEFNPIPHLIGIGILGAANPLIYVGRLDFGAWITPILGVAFLVALIGGGYRFLAPARAKAAGLKPFILLAWVLVALVTLQAWTDGSTKVHPTATAAAAKPGDPLGGFDPSRARLVENQKEFDPSTARPIEWPPAASGQFDPSTAKPVQN